MNEPKFLDNPKYVRYIELFLQYNKLVAEGKGESAEAEALCDKMDKPWSQLSAAEMERARIISADLDMLTGDEVFRNVPPEQKTAEWLEPRIGEAMIKGDWDAVLALLRNGPDYRKPDELAYIRASAYARLGHFDIALQFAEYAHQVNPQDQDTSLFIMQILLRLNRNQEAAELANNALIDPKTTPFQRFAAISGILPTIQKMQEREARAEYQRIGSILQKMLQTDENNSINELDEYFGLQPYTLMAYCYLAVNLKEDALNIFNGILAREPNNQDALEGVKILTSNQSAETKEQQARQHIDNLAANTNQFALKA